MALTRYQPVPKSAGLLLTCLCALFLGTPPILGDDAPDAKAKPPLFDGIELGPGILDAVNEPKRMNLWTQPEIDAYYQVLDFARRTDYSKQKDRARQNALNELKRIRKKIEAEYARKIKAIEAGADKLGTVRTLRLRSFASQVRRKRLKEVEAFQEDLGEFPLNDYLVASLVREKKRSRFRGKLVTLTGRLRRLNSYPAKGKTFGVKQLYEAWIIPKTSGKFSREDLRTNPVVVICTSIPEGIPQGDKISESITVTGYVFRLHRQSNQKFLSPMILASRIEWHPREPPSAGAGWIPGILIALLVFIVAAIAFFGRGDKANRRQQIDRTIEGPDAPVISPPDDAT